MEYNEWLQSVKLLTSNRAFDNAPDGILIRLYAEDTSPNEASIILENHEDEMEEGEMGEGE